MKIRLNGQDKVLTEAQNLSALIASYRPDNPRVIAEVNGEIVRQPQWDSIHLSDGDRVELVCFVGGG